MKPDPTLTLLIERSQEAYEQQTRKLGQATSLHDRQLQKLRMLEEYRSEYQNRLDQQSGSGMSMPELVNYRRFITQLDQAVQQQQRSVEQAELGVANARRLWQEAHRQLKSYEVLRERRAAAAQLSANRKEQRESDAYAQRISQTRKSPF